MTDIFSQTNFDDHEQVIFVTDPAAGLFGIIAIHDTVSVRRQVDVECSLMKVWMTR